MYEKSRRYCHVSIPHNIESSRDVQCAYVGSNKRLAMIMRRGGIWGQGSSPSQRYRRVRGCCWFCRIQAVLQNLNRAVLPHILSIGSYVVLATREVSSTIFPRLVGCHQVSLTSCVFSAFIIDSLEFRPCNPYFLWNYPMTPPWHKYTYTNINI